MKLPPQIKKRFAAYSENFNSKGYFKDMQKRFTQKTQTYEFMIRFQNTIEKTDESSIVEVQDRATGDIID